MGYIAHDVAVAVINDYDRDTLALIEGWRAALDEWWQRFVLGPVEGVNGYTIYVFAPDGSKEGWGPSDEGDRLRAQFVDLANGSGIRDEDRNGYGDVIQVRFGGDHGHEIGTEIVSTTDPKVRAGVA